MQSDISKVTQFLNSIGREKAIEFIAYLQHELTIGARGLYSTRDVTQSSHAFYSFNETMHRITSRQITLLRSQAKVSFDDIVELLAKHDEVWEDVYCVKSSALMSALSLYARQNPTDENA